MGVPIDLGGADVFAAPAVLGLTNAELNGITAGTQDWQRQQWRASVKADILRPAPTAVELTSGSDVVVGAGQVNTGGGILTIRPCTASAVKPTKVGTDATASALTLGGSVAISIASAANYDRLEVAGNLDLSGASLFRSGAYVPTLGDVFTIVSVTGGTIEVPLPISRKARYSRSMAPLAGPLHADDCYAHIADEHLSRRLGQLGRRCGERANDNITITVSGANYRISDTNGGNVFFTPIAGATGTSTNLITIPIGAVAGKQIQIKSATAMTR